MVTVILEMSSIYDNLYGMFGEQKHPSDVI